ncbi:hypothetical protein BC939DRAFT_446278 [Gamsiella multidivaricata]|uniref:uncharacterized protein n=1 Tax=Gamsiella multidivaricata TaxID=101098 RepID=UPI00221E6C39|nr:uncharacterized protein BC939DRAFT_446278 [Gamsiella multidivaricata]KAI7826943.1 hypothetical protein BC939DRAFT_446278 [Gamsiella multidivaricata]
MVQHSPQNFTLLAFLLLQYSLLVSGIIVSQPSASSVWAPGKTYSIKVLDEHRGKTVKGWQVDLMVLGGECDGICLHDGIAAEIAKGYNTRSSLQFTVPADLIQHGKVCLCSLLSCIQLST